MVMYVYLAIIITALYGVAKVLLPEMIKSPISKRSPGSGPSEIDRSSSSDNKITKLEILLAEKNKNIQQMQTELRISQVQIRDFEKFKALLEDEIDRLREQNRMFRSELGMPTVASLAEHK